MLRGIVTLGACAAVLAVGLLGMRQFAAMKAPPKQAEAEEAIIRVEARTVAPEDVEVTLKGYGDVRTLNSVAVAPEVSGKVIEIHPNLEVGGLVPEGEVLFKIDPRDYEANVADAGAAVKMAENALTRLRKQYAIDQDRLKTLQRSRELAKSEFERVKQLFEKDQVGTRSGVEQSERAYNGAADQAEQLSQAVELYPVRIQEAENALTSARSRLDIAQVRLERTVLTAPFYARVKSVSLEAGQYVSPGVSVLTLADDSVLEVSVPLDSREARKWLRFQDGTEAVEDAWFTAVEPVACEIRWTEDKANHTWEGTLNRVEKFDQQTRTVTVAVRVEGEKARSRDPEALPLVEGMFCEVRVPGRVAQNVYRLPSRAVNFEGLVYCSVEGRLQSREVERVFMERDEVFIGSGLNPGDIVVTTRLVDPLENSLLDLTMETAKDGEGAEGAEGKEQVARESGKEAA